MTQLSAKSGVASGSLSALSNAAFGTQVAFLGLSVATTASLIPALVALSTALLPIVSALGGFVAAGAAIGGIGLVGVIGAIATNTERLKTTFNSVISTIEREFAPVFDLAAGSLLFLMEQFEAIIPALVPAENVIGRIARNFEILGTTIIESLPAFVDLATTLTTEFLPPFVDFAQDVLPEIPELITNFTDDLQELLPSLMRAGSLLFDLLGAATEFGFTVLTVLGPALTTLTRGLTDAFRAANNAADGVGELIAAGSIAAPIVIGLASVLGGPLGLALTGVIAAVVGLAQAFRTNFANIRSYLSGLWREFQSVLPALQSAFDSLLTGVDVQSILNNFSKFEDVLGNQLMTTLEELQPVFDGYTQLLKDNSEEVEIIGEAVGALVNSGIKLATVLVSLVGPAFRAVIIPTMLAAIDVVDFLITKFASLIEITQALSAGNFDVAGEIAIREGERELSRIQSIQEQIAGENTNQQPRDERIEVIVEGDTDVVRDVSTQVVNEESRRNRRNTGSPTGVR